jgi:hypothetical protein
VAGFSAWRTIIIFVALGRDLPIRNLLLSSSIGPSSRPASMRSRRRLVNALAPFGSYKHRLAASTSTRTLPHSTDSRERLTGLLVVCSLNVARASCACLTGPSCHFAQTASYRDSKSTRAPPTLSSSWYISFVPLQVVHPDFLRRPRSNGKRRITFFTGGDYGS